MQVSFFAPAVHDTVLFLTHDGMNMQFLINPYHSMVINIGFVALSLYHNVIRREYFCIPHPNGLYPGFGGGALTGALVEYEEYMDCGGGGGAGGIPLPIIIMDGGCDDIGGGYPLPPYPPP
jgi:hypothetical protein